MSKKNSKTKSEDKNQRASWKLIALNISLKKDGEEEPMAYVRTPEGDRWVPMSEAKGKVDLFEQLPEYKKEEFARWVFEKIREKKAEEEGAQSENTEEASDEK